MNSLFERAGLQVLERGWLSSNNVLFAGNAAEESVLVDSGYATHGAQTVALVRRELRGRKLDRLVNTHLHSDHCGGNHALQRAFGCTIAVPAGEAAKVDAWDEQALTYHATGQQCPRFERTGSIRAGDLVRCGRFNWEAIAAPGHDPESLVLYQPDLALLISADALWENGFGVVFPELEGSSAFDDVRATLHRLSGLRVQWVIPGHGRPFQDSQGAIDRALRRLDSFIENPVKHAQHAAKVLIKFHLLEVQQQTHRELHVWLGATPCLRSTHNRFFSATPFTPWCERLIDDLVASGALGTADGSIVNI